MTIDVDEISALDAVLSLPLDRESRVGIFDADRFRITVAGHPRRQVIGRIEQPRIAGFGREENQLANGDNAPVVLGSPTLNVAHLVGKAKTLAVCDGRPLWVWARSSALLSWRQRSGQPFFSLRLCRLLG